MKLTTDNFIKQYKAAVKAKLTKEQFSKLLGILPDSVTRRRLTVEKQTGIKLPFLNSNILDDDTPQTQLEKFQTAVCELEKKEYGKVTVNISGFSRYIITSAQNATPVHPEFLASLMTYCDANDARLIVVPYRYKNPTSIWSTVAKEDDVWAPSIVPYIVDSEIRITDNLILMANIKVQPTASEPVSGFEGFTGTNSIIIGHPKIQSKSVPTIKDDFPKLMVSTGAVTVQNYTDSKIGWKGAFHHSIAALIVEIGDDGLFHLRHVHADEMTGEFYDLDKRYSPTEVTSGHRVAALIAGDIHAEFIDPDVENATYLADDSIAAVCNPEKFIFHDLVDFYSRNHHHRGNDLIAVGKHRFGRNNVEKGLQQAADFIDRVTRDGTENIVVKSNHDEAFDRWLREADVRGDFENAQFYYYMKYHQMKNVRMTDTGFSSIDPLEFWCNNPDDAKGLINIDRTTFLSRDTSINVNGVELGFHGDAGPNGARGDIKSFAKLSTKVIIGHGHSPGIHEGCVQVGVSSRLNLEYKRGPSSWLCAHALVYPDGKRTLINVIKGKWKI
jgi:hypothetical protein